MRIIAITTLLLALAASPVAAYTLGSLSTSSSMAPTNYSVSGSASQTQTSTFSYTVGAAGPGYSVSYTFSQTNNVSPFNYALTYSQTGQQVPETTGLVNLSSDPFGLLNLF